MAKDGTNRGGSRIGSGRKRESLAEKIIGGKVNPNPADEPFKERIPNPKKYLNAAQKDGGKTYARRIYRETYEWLKSCGCEKIIAKQLVENYSQVSARHIQCEENISTYGLIARHPTTGEPVASPFVKISIDYLKQANQLWCQIYSFVRDNAKEGFDSEEDKSMETLLRRLK